MYVCNNKTTDTKIMNRKVVAGSALLMALVMLCSAFTTSKKNSSKLLIGKWAFEKAYVTTEPTDLVLEAEITQYIAKNYTTHYFEFNKDGSFVLHTPEESSLGKYLIIDNRIAFNDSVMKYGVEQFLNSSMYFQADKEKLMLSVPQDKASIQEVELNYGATLDNIFVNIIYKRTK